MLENPTDSSLSAVSIATIKRYAPPIQRNRSSGRRKSGGDHLERANSYGNNWDRNHTASAKNSYALDCGDTGYNNLVNENPHQGLIPLQGCCNSEAFYLLNNRWSDAMNAYNNPSIDLSGNAEIMDTYTNANGCLISRGSFYPERPVLYSGSGSSAWGQFNLPHQIMSSTATGGSSGSQTDFLSKLRHAIRAANANSDN